MGIPSQHPLEVCELHDLAFTNSKEVGATVVDDLRLRRWKSLQAVFANFVFPRVASTNMVILIMDG